MEFRQLHYFSAVVEEGSFSAAARKCGISQPSLSQQIQNFEAELGETLLKRGPRGVSLTEAGEIVYGRAKTMVAERDALIQSFQERGSLRAGAVSFGVIPTIAPSLLPDVLSRFHSWAPDVAVTVREGQTAEMIRMVVDDDIEFAVVSDIDPAARKKWSLHVKTIMREPLLLAVSSQDPLARLEHPVDVADIDPEDLLSLSDGHCLRDQTPAICKPSDLRDTTTCEQLPTMLALVRARLGVAFVPGMFVHENNTRGVEFLRVRNPEPYRDVNVMKRRGKKLTPVADHMLKLIGEW